MGLSSLLHSVPVAGNLAGGLYDQVTGQGNYNSNSNYTNLDADSAAQAKLRDQFAQQYGNLTPGTAPVAAGVTQATGQSDQSRGTQQSGLPTMQQGIGTQLGGVGVQQQGADIQKQGLGTQQQGIGVQEQGLGALQAGFGAQQQGLGTATDAANSYRSVLAGTQPSVADLEAQKLAGQNIASAYGGAASATGGNRAMALRAAINGAGANGAQNAANAGILTATEQAQARAGLLGASANQTGAGTAMGGTGTGISGVGQGITAGGQGISATGAGLAGTGQGISATGAGIVNSGTAQSNVGTATRGQDITQAADQANIDANAALANQASTIQTRGQDITQQANLGNLSNTAGVNAASTDSNKINQVRADKNQGQQNQSTLLQTGAQAIAASSDEVKTDIKPAAPSQISQLFASLGGGNPTPSSAPQSAAGASSSGSGGIDPSQVKQPTGGMMGSSPLSALTGGGGAGGGAGMDPDALATPTFAGSSRELKTSVKDDPAEARRMFAQIMPTTWKYSGDKMAKAGLTAPDTEGQDHLGVIAENVERAGPLGKGIVRKVNNVKGLDIPMAVSALMAAVADMEKRFGGKRKAA